MKVTFSVYNLFFVQAKKHTNISSGKFSPLLILDNGNNCDKKDFPQ